MSNYIKETAKKLNLTYKELGERIGYTESALKTASSTGSISEPMQKSLDLLNELHDLQCKNKEVEDFKAIVKNFINSL